MKRALAAMMLVVATATAHAQIAAALGKPLPSSDLAAGSITVRVVAGSPSNPVAGTDVTLTVNGTPRVARTDSSGRATFKDLPAGANVQAKVVDDDKKDVTSDTFPLPADGGVRLLLSTRPWNPGAGGGAPFAGGAGGAGMPEPRVLSGQPRPEQSDAPGTFTVRLTYDDLKDAHPPADVPVALVGYAADDSVSFASVKTDKDGRATFTGLDRTGMVAYFAMAQLPRGKDATIDRLISQPAVLDARTGIRLILSAEKRDSTEPAIDELAKLDKQEPAVPAGKVRVSLEGNVEPGEKVRLIDAATKAVLGNLVSEVAPADPGDLRSGSQFVPRADAPAGTIVAEVHGGPGVDKELANIAITIVPAGSPGATPVATAQTGADGSVRIAVPTDAGPLAMIATINGTSVMTQPFDVSKSGGIAEVQAVWSTAGRPQAVFDLVPAPGQVVYAETSTRGQLYRSLPFQPVPERGTHVSLFIFPRIVFAFSLTSHIDDEFLAVSGRFTLANNSWEPYSAGPDGIVLPMPAGFKGGIVAEQDQSEVAVVQGEGFRVIRPIPPGHREFHAGFSLPVHGGGITWTLPLPYGSFQSGMEILEVPGMSVTPPAGVEGHTVTVPQGTFYVMQQITKRQGESMTISIQGLPAVASWRIWMPRFVGVLAIVLMLGGLGFALTRRGEDDAVERKAKRSALLDELVALEKTGTGGKPGTSDARREAILAELESLWED